MKTTKTILNELKTSNKNLSARLLAVGELVKVGYTAKEAGRLVSTIC